MPVMPIDSIHVAPALQLRKEGTNGDVVKEYAEAAKAGANFPPLVLYRVTDRKYKGPALVAGFHRLAAYRSAGVTECECEVHEGTFSEAWLAAWRSNQAHGVRYSNADKRQAAEQALRMFPTDSNRQLAERMGLSNDFIGRVRKEMEAAGQIERVESVTSKDGVRVSTKQKPKSEEVSSDDTSSDSATSVAQSEPDSDDSGDDEPEAEGEPGQADGEQPDPFAEPAQESTPDDPALDPRFMPHAKDSAAFAERFRNWKARLVALRTDARKAFPDRNSVMARRIDFGGFDSALTDMIETIDRNIPEHACPQCCGTGDDAGACKFCDGYGIIDKHHHDGLKARWKRTAPRLAELLAEAEGGVTA